MVTFPVVLPTLPVDIEIVREPVVVCRPEVIGAVVADFVVMKEVVIAVLEVVTAAVVTGRTFEVVSAAPEVMDAEVTGGTPDVTEADVIKLVVRGEEVSNEVVAKGTREFVVITWVVTAAVVSKKDSVVISDEATA